MYKHPILHTYGDEYVSLSKSYKVKDKERLKAVVRTSLTHSVFGGQAEVCIELFVLWLQ